MVCEAIRADSFVKYESARIATFWFFRRLAEESENQLGLALAVLQVFKKPINQIHGDLNSL